MSRRIKVRTLGKETVREVDLFEAQRLLERIYKDPVGGLVIDAKSRQVIWEIGPEVEEMIIMEQWLGGG